VKFPWATHRVLITSTKENAEKWKRRIQIYLKEELKLNLSEEKTKITNIKKKPIHFVGFTFKVVKGKSRKGYVTRTKPNPERLKAKVKEIRIATRKLKKHKPNTIWGKKYLINEINLINSKIRGLINYYKVATWVNIELQKYGKSLSYSAYKALKPHGGKWTPAKNVSNLTSVHAVYETNIPAITYKEHTIGITNLNFSKWEKSYSKNQNETPFTENGRKLYQTRTNRKPLQVRVDELVTTTLSQTISRNKDNKIYNFEYYLNRPYAFNRDKGKCKICGEKLGKMNLHTHHNDPNLPLNMINRVNNLSSVCRTCHKRIHDENDYSFLDNKTWKKILRYREKLDHSHEVNCKDQYMTERGMR